MRQCCFLTTDRLDGFVADDDLALGPLRRLGWHVLPLPWRQTERDWGDFEVVVIRSTWDYQNHLPDFLRVLGEIDRSPARLLNPLGLVGWNARKTYLRDLEARGIRIVPTVWSGSLDAERLDGYFRELGSEEIVLKPVVSANAYHTHRVRRGAAAAIAEELVPVFGQRAHLAQPFVPGVVVEGEFSLMYVAGELSHTILKTPRRDDFRVQEEHGGTMRRVDPEPALLAAGRAVLSALDPAPFYARVDLVRAEDRGFMLMELELIEPSLYLRMCDGAPERFARSLHQWMGG